MTLRPFVMRATRTIHSAALQTVLAASWVIPQTSRRCCGATPMPITLSALMQAYVDEQGSVGILHRSFSSCLPLETKAGEVMELTSGCLEFNEAVQKELAELRTHGLKGVVLSAMWITLYRDKVKAFSAGPVVLGTSSFATQADYARYAVDEIVSKLVSEGLRVLIVAPTWIMPHRVPQCLVRHGNEECSAERAPIEKERKAALAMLRKIEAEHKRSVRVWDPINDLCDTRICPAARGTMAMYTDDLHLSASAARQLLEQCARTSYLADSG